MKKDKKQREKAIRLKKKGKREVIIKFAVKQKST
jgi:hypothetical protein